MRAGGGGGPTGLERFEYPVQGGYGTGRRASEGIEDGEVERVARLRMQADEAEHVRVEGASMVRTLAAGHRFTPYDVANPDNVFAPHVVTSVTHEVVDTSYESVANQPDYANRFAALPADVPATPRRATPRPRIDGVQVAIVAGPPGEEIHPDAHGRVKLWFPWDRRAKKDGTDTCWVRVAQSWAGAGWGAQTIPRIGMEVMVSYLDGDPDRPVVTGVVPNKAQKVPYELPEHKTRSTFRTNSHKADYHGFNELRFEDERGEEEIYVRAQKDRNEKVENNQSQRINVNKVESVGDSKASEVHNIFEQVVGGDMRLFVGPEQRGKITPGNASEEIEGIGGTTSLIGHGAGQRGEGTLEATIEKDLRESVGRNVSQVLGKVKRTSVGESYYIDVEKDYVLDVGERLTLKCGQSVVTLTKDGTITVGGVKGTVNMDQLLKLLADVVKIN